MELGFIRLGDPAVLPAAPRMADSESGGTPRPRLRAHEDLNLQCF